MRPHPPVLLSALFAFVIALPLAAQSTLHRLPGAVGDDLYRIAGPLQLDADGVPDYVLARLGEVVAVSGQKGTPIYSLSFSTAGATTNIGGHCHLGVVGDLNGDGYDEFSLGVPGDDTNGLRSGRCTIHSGIDGSIIYSYLGAADANADGSGDTLGYRAGGVGDLNGDGTPDFYYAAVGDIWDEQNFSLCSAIDDAGYLHVRSGADGSLLATHIGAPGCDKWWAACPIDDVDGDGHDDYGITNSLSSLDNGTFSLRSGFDHSEIRVHHGAQLSEYFGDMAVGLGDVDGDGTRDYAVGAPSPWCSACGFYGAGLVYVYSGSSGTLLHSLQDASLADFFGNSISDVGDFDGDGFDDFAIGAPRDDSAGMNFGRVMIFSGADASLLWSIEGESVEHKLGAWYGVVNLGDVNFDGELDLAIASFRDAAGSSFTGEVRTVSTSSLAFFEEGHLLSIANGGQIDFFLEAGTSGAFDTYFILGSVTGFAPGIATPDGVYIPLIPDPYFDMTVDPNQNPIATWTGLLDGFGQTQAYLGVPPGALPPYLLGYSLYHAYVTYDFMAQGFEFGSNHVIATIVP